MGVSECLRHVKCRASHHDKPGSPTLPVGSPPDCAPLSGSGNPEKSLESLPLFCSANPVISLDSVLLFRSGDLVIETNGSHVTGSIDPEFSRALTSIDPDVSRVLSSTGPAPNHMVRTSRDGGTRAGGGNP